MSEAITIHCGERLSIEQVEALLPQLEESLHASGGVILDGADVQYCDTAGLQLLLSLQKTLSQTGHAVQWSNTSDVLLETAGYLGLRAALHLPESTSQN